MLRSAEPAGAAGGFWGEEVGWVWWRATHLALLERGVQLARHALGRVRLLDGPGAAHGLGSAQVQVQAWLWLWLWLWRRRRVRTVIKCVRPQS